MADNVTISETDDGQRLDRWLKKHYPEAGFAGIQKILRTGQVRVDGKRAKGDARLQQGQVVRIPPQMASPLPKEKRGLSPKDIDFVRSLVIYEDAHMIALNKPAGIATQGGTKINRHIDGLLDGLAQNGVRPHLVHRLDKDTSGVLLLARNPKVARALGDLFQGRDIRKYYWAITVPAPQDEMGEIRSRLEKGGGPGQERMRNAGDGEGKFALTYYQVMETAHNKLAFVAFWPKTGRMHQIRAHAAEMGCPLLGDYKYGYDPELLEELPNLPDMLHLHARRVILPHPMTGRLVDITASLDPDMGKTWKFFHFNANDKSDPFEDVE